MTNKKEKVSILEKQVSKMIEKYTNSIGVWK
jgi:hypothetical protein